MNGIKDKFLKPEIAFVFCALIFGLLLIVLTPPMQSADEQYHFSRAYSIAHGEIKAQKLGNLMGDYLPTAFRDFGNSYFRLYSDKNARTSFSEIKINSSEKFFCHQSYMALYSPAAYLPQSIGIAATGLSTGSVYLLLISAKLFLLLFYTSVGYFTLKSMPFLKWTAFLLLLMPMSLSMGASVSADGVLIAVCALYFAKILQYSYEKAPLNKNAFSF